MSHQPFLHFFFERPCDDISPLPQLQSGEGKGLQSLGTETFTKARGENGDTDISELGELWDAKII